MTMPNQDLSEKILHVLTIYPKISPSMLQISLNLPASFWKPVLEELIFAGKILRTHVVSPTPTGRHQTYTILAKADSEVDNMEIRAAE